MSEKSLVLLGAGGHCMSCIDVIESVSEWRIEGILDRQTSEQSFVLDYPIIGTDDDISKYIRQGVTFLITVGQIKSSAIRKRLFDRLKSESAKFATIISSKACLSKYAEVGAGSIVHHFSSINSGARVGENCIINTLTNIEHEVRIGDHTHISTGVMVNGAVSIGNNCFVGSGTVIANGVSIADNVIIGAQSLVLSDISEAGVHIGSPCKRIKE